MLKPILENSEQRSIKDICEEYGIASERKASNMITTTKRRFGSLLCQSLRQFVQSDSDVDDELRDLLEIVSAGDVV